MCVANPPVFPALSIFNVMKKELVNERDGYKVYIVDGNYVRDNVDVEFTNFGQHFRFRFIPRWEIWLDKDHGRGEREPFEVHAIKEANEMSQGVDYSKAYEDGLKAENECRLTNDKRPVHKRIIHQYGDVTVWLVDGKVVRDKYDKGFTEGGHWKVYKYVPEGEVWIDDQLSDQERKPVLLHEMNELGLMRQGMPYLKAHKRSSIREGKFRKLFSKNKYPSLKITQ